MLPDIQELQAATIMALLQWCQNSETNQPNQVVP
jgi:hypothetical protein